MSTVPFARDSDFIGRQDVMAILDAKLKPLASHERVALVGLGGVGQATLNILLYKNQADYFQEVTNCYRIFLPAPIQVATNMVLLGQC